jgi:hypothetical protein
MSAVPPATKATPPTVVPDIAPELVTAPAPPPM